MVAAGAAGLPIAVPGQAPVGTILVRPQPPCQVIDLTSGAELFLNQRLGADPCRSLWWSPDGKRVAGVYADKTVTVWDAASGAELAVLRGQAQGLLVFGTVGTGLSSGAPKGFSRFEPAPVLREAVAASGPAPRERPRNRILWAPRGTHLAAVFADPRAEYAQVWPATGGDSFLILGQEGYDLNSLRWSPDGQRLAALWNHWLAEPGESSGAVYVQTWDAASGTAGVRLKCADFRAKSAAFAWSADGRRMVTAHGPGSQSREDRTGLRAYDAVTGEEASPAVPLTGPVAGLAFSPDGRFLVVEGGDRKVKVWNAGSGKELYQLKDAGVQLPPDPWSPDGKYLRGWVRNAEADEPLTHVWALASGEEVVSLKHRVRDFDLVAWAPDGKQLATLEGGTLKVWEVPHKAAVPAGEWSPGGRRVASAPQNGSIRLTDVRTGAVLDFHDHAGGPVGAAAWSPDGRHLATAGADHNVKVWEAGSGVEVRTLRGHGDPVGLVWWSADGRRLISASSSSISANPAIPSRIKVWDPNTGAEVLTLHGPQLYGVEQLVRWMALSQDGRYLAAASFAQAPGAAANGDARVWDLTSGKVVLESRIQSPPTLTLSADGKRLAALSDEATLKVWDVVADKEVCTVHDERAFKSRPFGLALVLSPDGRRLAVHDIQGGAITMWDAVTGAKVPGAKALRPVPAGRVAWGPDGSRLLTSPAPDSTEGAVAVWDPATGEAVARLTKEEAGGALAAAEWAPDGRLVAVAVRQGQQVSQKVTVHIWDVARGAKLRALPGEHADRVAAVRWSPDGKRLVSCSWDQTARVWDVATGAALTLRGHAGDRAPRWSAFTYEPNQGWGNQLQVGRMAWSPDGRRVASASRFGALTPNGVWQGWSAKVRIWDATAGTTLRVLEMPAAPVWTLVWSPDGRFLATVSSPAGGAAGKAEVKVWDAVAGRGDFSTVIDQQLPSPFTSPTPTVNIPLAFSPEGRRLAVEDGNAVKVWDLVTGAQARVLPAAAGPLAWDLEGRRLATRFGRPGETVVKVWDATTGADLRTVTRAEGVQALLWGPGGQRLFVGGRDGIMVWDPEAGTRFLTLKAPAERLWWAPGGRDLVSVGPKGAQVWETSGDR
jgi:WD40 repeat protein